VLVECSLLESPLGALSFEFEDEDERSVVDTVGAIGATTTGAGATTTGAAYTTAGGGGAEVVVVEFDVVVSVESANAIGTLANSAAIPIDKAAVLNECFKIISPVISDFHSKDAFSFTARTAAVLIAV
jgi:hypothetical protein